MGMGGGGGEEAIGSFPSGSEEKRLRPGVGNEATIAIDDLFRRLDYREMVRFDTERCCSGKFFPFDKERKTLS